MMKFDIVTIFPTMVSDCLKAGVLGRAIERGTILIAVRDLRDFTSDRHRVVDDVPYGGGPGMVMKPEPIFRALDAISTGVADGLVRPRVILTSPQGVRFTQGDARRLSRESHVVLLCGRYEGVDERVRFRVDEELSVGDYVLTGGELPALIVLDAIARLVPGVVGDEQSVEEESFSRGLLDFPQYTRPADLEWPGVGTVGPSMRVPEVLLSGNHAEIRRWRKRAALEQTLTRRPDLLADAALDEEEREMLRDLTSGREGG